MYLILIEFTDTHHILGILLGTSDIMVSLDLMVDTYKKTIMSAITKEVHTSI